MFRGNVNTHECRRRYILHQLNAFQVAAHEGEELTNVSLLSTILPVCSGCSVRLDPWVKLPDRFRIESGTTDCCETGLSPKSSRSRDTVRQSTVELLYCSSTVRQTLLTVSGIAQLRLFLLTRASSQVDRHIKSPFLQRPSCHRDLQPSTTTIARLHGAKCTVSSVNRYHSV